MPEPAAAFPEQTLPPDPAHWGAAFFPHPQRPGAFPRWWLIVLLWLGAASAGPAGMLWMHLNPKHPLHSKIGLGGGAISAACAIAAMLSTRGTLKRHAWLYGRIEPAIVFDSVGGITDSQLTHMVAHLAAHAVAGHIGSVLVGQALGAPDLGIPSSARFLTGTAFPMVRVNDGRIVRGTLRLNLGPQHQIARSDVIWVVRATRFGPCFALADVAPREFAFLKAHEDIARAFKHRLREIQAPRGAETTPAGQPQGAGPRLPKPRKPAP